MLSRVRTLLLAAVAMALMASPVGAQGPSFWSPKVSVETAFFTDANPQNYISINAVSVSPDGRYVFTVRRRGDLSCDCNIDEMLLFSAEDLERGMADQTTPPPVRSFSLRSKTNRPAILAPRWVENGPAIAFIGTVEDRPGQVFLWEDQSAAPRQVTQAPGAVLAFDMRGGSVVYMAPGERAGVSQLGQYPAVFLGPNDFARAFGGPDFALPHAIYAAYKGGEAKRITEPAPLQSLGETTIAVSPDGAAAVIVSPVADQQTPPSWRSYSGAAKPTAAQRVGSGFSEFLLVDLRTGAKRPLTGTPTGHAARWPANPGALWRADGGGVVLVDVTVPVSPDVPETLSHAYILDYDLASGRYDLVARLPRTAEAFFARWNAPGGELTVAGPQGAEVYAKSDTGWVRQEGVLPNVRPRGVLANGIEVLVAQDANTPPTLIAQRDRDELILTGPDPALFGIRRAKTESFEWRDSAGRTWTGALTLPPGGRDKAGPLVIQAGPIFRELFQPDGATATAYAAQSLAANGIAVLNMQPMVGGPDAPDAFVEGLDAAVDELAKRGIADRTKVGLVGFSYQGYLTLYALTHPGRTRFAAAVDADGNDHSYTQYLFYSVLSSAARASAAAEYERDHGGAFWENPDEWLERAPGFNLDNVEAPLLLTVAGYGREGRDFAQWLEKYAGLHVGGKAVELLYFPKGEHILVRPGEILASQTATLDWMKFWLQGVEDRDPAKQAQYARWREWRDGPRPDPSALAAQRSAQPKTR